MWCDFIAEFMLLLMSRWIITVEVPSPLQNLIVAYPHFPKILWIIDGRQACSHPKEFYFNFHQRLNESSWLNGVTECLANVKLFWFNCFFHRNRWWSRSTLPWCSAWRWRQSCWKHVARRSARWLCWSALSNGTLLCSSIQQNWRHSIAPAEGSGCK